ncbi:unnamed protein product [Hyaloperonospora brassicae]|uniref:V-SNARE coiled-coil homology domain-containing protein n=1 Tax=Hyaloperonospora brassicae TaxID=162125 RepID=A0AAV0SV56_HYABA|nr:unnamed protein product [Hyaloperonospora brassicae]
MAFPTDKACRHLLASQRKSSKQRRAEQRQRVKCFVPRSYFLVIPGTSSHHQQAQSKKYFGQPVQLPECDEDDILGPDEVVISDTDLRAMRDSVDNMQQQLSRGLRDIEEIRALVREAAVRDSLETDARRANSDASSSSSSRSSL